MATTNSIAKPSSEPAVKTAKLFKNGRSQAVRLPKGFRIEGDRVRLSFDYAGSGLMVGAKEGRAPAVEQNGGKLKRFAIAGADKNWVWADAAIEGQTVVVSAPGVKEPVAVRYAFSMNPAGANLYNREGLPAAPFRTDGW